MEEEQGHRFARAAKAKGIQHYVYTSVGSAHKKTGIPHFENKARIEQTVRELGFPSWVIMRPVFFMENLVSPWFLNGDKLTTALKPQTTLQMIASDDVGKFGALAFDKAQTLNRAEIDLAGDATTMPVVAELMSAALGRKISFMQLPIEEIRKNSEDFALMLEWFDRTGYSADIEGVQRKFGLQFVKLKDWLERNAKKG